MLPLLIFPALSFAICLAADPTPPPPTPSTESVPDIGVIPLATPEAMGATPPEPLLPGGGVALADVTLLVADVLLASSPDLHPIKQRATTMSIEASFISASYPSFLTGQISGPTDSVINDFSYIYIKVSWVSFVTRSEVKHSSNS
jgi:hypothetical protein